MLNTLHIENLAVIESADIEFGSSFNAFTGETGAGKSILIGGINAVLGKRVSKDIIRSGAEKAFISAVFTNIPEETKIILENLGIEASDELIISREINIDGRSSARVNMRPINVSSLKEIGDTLVAIHGQHDNQILLDPEKHLGILDNFAESDAILEDYKEAFKELQNTAREITKQKLSSAENAKRVAYLTEIINDIGSSNVTLGEDIEVENRFRYAQSSAFLKDSILASLSLLNGSDETPGISDLIAKAYSELVVAEDVMQPLKAINERLSSAGIELGDIANELNGLLDTVDLDEGEFERLTARKNELNRLKHKYGPTLENVIKTYENANNELLGISENGQLIASLEEKKVALLGTVTRKAEELSKHRKAAAEHFVSNVSNELSFLNMPDVRIEVSFVKGKLTSSGMDNVEFLISANKGEEPKPLSKIASGGELSRIMLALKTVLADRDYIPSMIFDEIDSGVSGRAAQKIGIKLRELSCKHQVICVTHLAQIAIMANDHMLIEKGEKQGRTATTITKLDKENRIYEIARILGGDNITPTVLKDAEEQLNSVI